MFGLRKDLSPEQVEAILDKYTIGKVAFTITESMMAKETIMRSAS
jgi:hypothetical protein